MAKILNNILCTAMIFLLTFAWTVYCLKDLRWALTLSLVVAAAGGYLIFAVLTKWQNKKQTKQAQQKKLKDFSVFLQFNCDNSALFLPMLCYYNFIAEIVDFDSIIISKERRTLAVFCFETEQLSAEKLQSAVVCAKRRNCDSLLVFCNKADAVLQSVANGQIPTQFVDLANTYDLFEKAEKLPKIPTAPQVKRRFLPQFAFNKKRFGWYFLGAVLSLATAAVSVMKLYLLVWATVQFGLSMYCLFNKKYNKTPTDVKLQ